MDITSGVYSPGSIDATQATAGEAFSFSTSFTQGDAIPTSAATTGEIQNFGIMTSNASGTAGDLAWNNRFYRINGIDGWRRGNICNRTVL